jgi:hypothetical protein
MQITVTDLVRIYWDASFGRGKGFRFCTMHFYIESLAGAAIFSYYELYTRFSMTVLSKLVSISLNRLSVIFLIVCHRVTCCLQLFITSSLQMPPRSMGVSLPNSPMTWPFYVHFGPNGCLRWTSGATRLMEAEGEFVKNPGCLLYQLLVSTAAPKL